MDKESPGAGPMKRPLSLHTDGVDDFAQELGTEPPHWSALARQLAGDASTEDDTVLRGWVEEHPTDAAAIAALERTLDTLAFAPSADLDVEAALRKVRARRAIEETVAAPLVPAAPVESDPKVVPLRRPRVVAAPQRRWATPLRAAAAIVVLVGGAAIWRARGNDARPQSFATAVGQRDSVRLADGTRVILAPGSVLDVPAGYGAAQREVQLRGEALFEVRHDAAHPFRVQLRGATVHDVGTEFVVREGDDGGVTVSVREGAVLLNAATPTSATPSDSGIVLRAGDRGQVAAGRVTALPGTAVPDDAAWTSGTLAFRDATVPEVVAELRRWYGLEVRLADSSLADRHITAVFHGESADQVLHVIGLALGTVMERRGDTVTVRANPPAAR